MSSPAIEKEPTYENIRWLDFNITQGNFPFTPEDRFTFSPLPHDPISIEGLALLLIIKKLASSPEGLKALERIAIKYLDSCARIVESVEDACHTNWLTALNNQHISLAIAHKIGLIGNDAYIKTMDHYRSVFDKMWTAQMAGQILDGVTTLVQGAKVGTGELGTGAAGLGALAKLAGI